MTDMAARQSQMYNGQDIETTHRQQQGRQKNKRHADVETEGQKDRWTDRQAGRQADRQPASQTERDR